MNPGLGLSHAPRHRDRQGMLIGGHLGAHLSIARGNRWIKRAFEALTLLVGIKLLLS